MDYQTIEDVVKDLEENPAESGGHIYHRIPFAEFDHLNTSSSEEAVQQKWSAIESKCSELFGGKFDGKQILDIGANGGFYTFSLAKNGAEVVSFELHPRYAPIGKFLAKQKQLPVTWNPTGFDPKLIPGKSFDVALMLSVYQWMCGGDSSDEKSLGELRYISQHCKHLIFELGFNQGKSCLKTSRRNHYAYLVDYLQKNTDYTHFQMMLKTKLWKGYSRYLVLCSKDSRFDDPFFRKISRAFKI